jgi:branched-chain amino acid transport system ATP-binding protein
MPKALLVCSGLTMRFGGLTALDALDFSVGIGEVIGLVGPNGSGKTTLFNVLTGLYRPSVGLMDLSGQDIFQKSPQFISTAGVARTFQRSRLVLDQTVFDNIAVGAIGRLGLGLVDNVFRRRRWRRELDALIAEAETLVSRFNPRLGGRLFEATGSFSMIDRRRIEICRALIASPRLLLLDEPSAGMTGEETRKLMDDVLSFKETSPDLSVVLVEHEMDVVRRVSDRCVVLNFGRKIFEGSFEDLSRDSFVQAAYLGDAA